MEKMALGQGRTAKSKSKKSEFEKWDRRLLLSSGGELVMDKKQWVVAVLVIGMLILIVGVSILVVRSSMSEEPKLAGDSKYLPSIDNGDGSYRFSKAQLAEMARTPLDRSLFLQYVETKWPLDKLKSYCTKENIWPEGYQNLVATHLCFHEWEIPVHKGKKHDFDKIFVYVSDDGGESNYYGSLAKTWRRWDYSLNVIRGKDCWAIIESLPNDFMNNPAKYLPERASLKK